MRQKLNIQNISFFWNLYQQNLIQFNSSEKAWNQAKKDYLIDNIIENYPIQIILAAEIINMEGITQLLIFYGQQRLTAIFEFLDNKFPYKGKIEKYQSKYFQDFDDQDKLNIWRYQIFIEYIQPCDDKSIIDILKRLKSTE